MKNVIIDCDPGIDDTLALFLAMKSPELNIKLITTAPGNVSVDDTTCNALNIVALAGKKIPVAKGWNSPLKREVVSSEEVHGDNGLGGVELPVSGEKALEGEARDHIYTVFNALEGDVELITMAPLTNIARFLTAYPEMKKKMKRITVMGGTSGRGNMSPWAEFNIFADPHSARVVFDSGIEITLCSLDVTEKALLLIEDIEKLRNSSDKAKHLLGEMAITYFEVYKKRNGLGAALHDPLTVAYVIKPELFTTKKARVDVITEEGEEFGRTVVTHSPMGESPSGFNVNFIDGVDYEGFMKLIQERIIER